VSLLNFTHLYTTRIENTIDDDLQHILATFKELINKGKTGIKLINYYQGLPLCYPATMVSVDREILDLDINPQQAVAIQREHYTFIRHNAFKHDVCAHVQYVNVKRRAVSLKNFFFVEIMAEQRNSIRLVMDPPADATFDIQGVQVNGKLLDISMTGAAVKVEQLPELEEGFETTLHIMLPNIIQNTHDLSQLPAQHVATKKLEDSYKCIFSITPDKILEQHISKYIFQRQVEIIRDLKDASI
jgi:hypothetical protein